MTLDLVQSQRNITSKELLRLHSLILYLKSISLRQLLLLKNNKKEIYIFKNNHLKILFHAGENIDLKLLKSLQVQEEDNFFAYPEDIICLNESLFQKLISLSRSFSQTDQLKNALTQTNLLTLQMENLYQNPFDDQLLKNHFQISKNFSGQLLINPKNQKEIYHQFNQQPHHYLVAQPMLSSLLLLSFCQFANIFTSKEISDLFLASYFKDIGFSFMKKESRDKSELTKEEREFIKHHDKFSVDILKGRIPLTKDQLLLISTHQEFTIQAQEKIEGISTLSSKIKTLGGIETTLIIACDIIVAMINPRPFRKALTLFEAMEKIRTLMQEDYPHEFKLLVKFIRHFFSK
jgi:hypothetical protein